MSQPTAQILLDTNRTIAEISPLLFGGFAEHMGRCVYEGIYEPKSAHADKNGLRTDVLDALRAQKYRQCPSLHCPLPVLGRVRVGFNYAYISFTREE